MAVVLIACPCALGLATPLAVWSSLGHAAGAGVLFRSGDALERLASIRAVRFDKTGTLTTGAPVIASIVFAEGDHPAAIARRASALAAASTHVLARTILTKTGNWGVSAVDVRSFAGRGVAGTVDSSPFSAAAA